MISNSCERTGSRKTQCCKRRGKQYQWTCFGSLESTDSNSLASFCKLIDWKLISVFWGKKVLPGGVSWWFSGLLTVESVGKRPNFGANGYTETGLEHKGRKDAWTFYFSRMRMEYYFPPWRMCSLNFMLGKLIKKKKKKNTKFCACRAKKQPAKAVCGNPGGDASVSIVCECVVFLREHHRGVEMCCDV